MRLPELDRGDTRTRTHMVVVSVFVPYSVSNWINLGAGRRGAEGSQLWRDDV